MSNCRRVCSSNHIRHEVERDKNEYAPNACNPEDNLRELHFNPFLPAEFGSCLARDTDFGQALNSWRCLLRWDSTAETCIPRRVRSANESVEPDPLQVFYAVSPPGYP